MTFSNSHSKKRWYFDSLLFMIGGLVLALDQVTKLVVSIYLNLGESWPSEGFFRFTYATNTGSAFSLFQDQTLFLIVASFIAILFLLYFYKIQSKPGLVLRIAIGLQLGGAFGNLIDRIWRGAVIDFLDVGWWPIFNVADSSVVVGMIALVYVLLTGRGRDKILDITEELESSDD